MVGPLLWGTLLQTQTFFTLRTISFANIKQMFIEDSYAVFNHDPWFNVCKHLWSLNNVPCDKHLCSGWEWAHLNLSLWGNQWDHNELTWWAHRRPTHSELTATTAWTVHGELFGMISRIALTSSWCEFEVFCFSQWQMTNTFKQTHRKLKAITHCASSGELYVSMVSTRTFTVSICNLVIHAGLHLKQGS